MELQQSEAEPWCLPIGFWVGQIGGQRHSAPSPLYVACHGRRQKGRMNKVGIFILICFSCWFNFILLFVLFFAVLYF